MEWDVQGKCGRYLVDTSRINKKEQIRRFPNLLFLLSYLVGTRGFEPPTP